MDNKNLILAVVLSVIILFGFQYLYQHLYPEPPVSPEQGQAVTESAPPRPGGLETPTVQPAPPASPQQPAGQGPIAAPTQSRAAALAEDPRIRIDTPRVHGSISLVGARIDDLTLVDYHETTDPASPEIVLLSPPGAPDALFAEAGWVAAGSDVKLPGPDTLWTADRDVLTPETPVTLTWNNGEGLTFHRTIAIDEHYMFTITQRVESRAGEAVRLYPYALISRYGTPEVSGYFILYEGPLGVFNDTLHELSYEELQKEGALRYQTTGGWIGMTSKYWLTAVIPDQTQSVDARFVFQRPGHTDRYQTDFLGQQRSLEPGQSVTAESRLFAGAKKVKLLDHYQDVHGIDRFDLAIDFGWFYFLTKPIALFLIYIKDLVGNLGIAILLLTILVKLAFFPLANKSYKAMSQMRKLQPEMMKLRERFGDDKVRLNQEMMALYKREKVNPASGCLPVVVQIPVFFALYKVLFVTIEMRHAPFFGWIKDLSAPDPTCLWSLFGLLPWDVCAYLPPVLNIGLWPLIMGITMFLQQKLNPQPPDPVQAKMFMVLPLVFTFMLAHFPAGLVIYWAWNNVLSMAQQWVIMRRMGVTI